MTLKRIILAAAIGLQLATGAGAQTQIALPKVSDRQRYVDTVDDLASIAGLKDGDLVTVKELGATYVYWLAGTSTVQEFSVLDGPGSVGRFMRHRGILVAESQASPLAWANESSTFSGWGASIGANHAPFNAVTLKVRSWDDSVTNIRVRVRAGGSKGPIIAQVLTALAEDANDEQTFTLDKTVDADCVLWVEYVTDGHIGNYGGYPEVFTEGYAHVKFTTGGSTSDTLSTLSTGSRDLWFQLHNTDASRPPLTSYDKRRLQGLYGTAPPRLDFRSSFMAMQNRNLEIFRRGIVDAADPYRYDWDWWGDIGGKQYRRRYVFDAASTTLNVEGVVTLRDDAGRYVAANTMRVGVFANPSSPASNVNILCVGDSLTANSIYVTELERMLTGTGGTPAGLALSNITFVGSQGSSPANHEGYSGQTWQWFAENESSPFVYSGNLNVSQYATDNSIASIDAVVILLTWNGWAAQYNLVEPEDFATYQAYVEDLIAAFQAYNADIKIILVGIPLTDPDGQADDQNDSGNNAYASANTLRRLAHGHNAMLANLANTYRTTGTRVNYPWEAPVLYVDSAARYDVEYNAQTQTVAVNERNAATETIGSNDVHPDTEGYYQIADTVLGAINAALLQ